MEKPSVGASADYLETIVNAFGPEEGIQLDQETWARLHGHIVNVLTPLRLRDLKEFP